MADDPAVTAGRGFPIEEVYGPQDLAGFDPGTALAEPGEFPYTRRP